LPDEEDVGEEALEEYPFACVLLTAVGGDAALVVVVAIVIVVVDSPVAAVDDDDDDDNAPPTPPPTPDPLDPPPVVADVAVIMENDDSGEEGFEREEDAMTRRSAMDWSRRSRSSLTTPMDTKKFSSAWSSVIPVTCLWMKVRP